MANYVFETMTTQQAAGFLSTDFLIFSNSATSASTLVVTPADGSGLQGASITLASGTVSLAFPQAALAAASTSAHLIFNDTSNLVLGTTDPNSAGAFNGGNANDVIYGFGGSDSITGGNGNDYLYGGSDIGTNATTTPPAAAVPGDTIDGGDGNDHIFGNASVAGGNDGPDLLMGGNGSDYVQGNGGNDTIDGGIGSDKLFGGAGDDSIVGGLGNDTIQGNLGNDIIDGANDNDFIRGGGGNDTVSGGNGDDVILGDLGNDSIIGGVGFDALTGDNGVGGLGNDVFVFANGDAAFNTAAGGATQQPTTSMSGVTTYNGGGTSTVTDLITDFQDGRDLIRLFGTNPTVVLHAQAATMVQGQQIAQSVITSAGNMAAQANTVAAVTVGSDTYLFYRGDGTAGGTIDSAIRVLGVGDSAFTSADFATV